MLPAFSRSPQRRHFDLCQRHDPLLHHLFRDFWKILVGNGCPGTPRWNHSLTVFGGPSFISVEESNSLDCQGNGPEILFYLSLQVLGIDGEEGVAEEANMKCLDCGQIFVGEIYDRCPGCLSLNIEEVADEKDGGYW